jgi:peptidoglycan/xylan/chitin deacetylase (PgdA/CDA1 family)/CelD/BcsL family acetyltransferase involved in cellulose biosynthesis
MRIERISTAPVFLAMQREWNSVLEQSAADTVFLTWEWMASWWAAYGEGKKLLILVARDPNGMCLGIAPLCVESGTTSRTVKFLGDGTFDSDYLDFIAVRGHEGEVVTAFLDHLKTISREWDILRISEIPEYSPSLEPLLSLKQHSGWFLNSEQVVCGIRKLPDAWDAFLATLRPRFRTTVRACLRNVEQWDGSFEVLSYEEQIPSWLHDLFALHSGRWAFRQQSGVFKNNEKRDFYHKLTQAVFRRGWLYMTRLRVNGVVLASQFGFVHRGVYFLLQEGFDVQCNHVSPGICLRAATIRSLIERRIHTYDFLGGIGRHKTDWGAQEKTSWRLTLAPKSVSGYVRVELPIVVQHAKDKVKHALPSRLLNWWKSRNAHKTPGSSDDAGELVGSVDCPKKLWKEALASSLYKSGLLRILERVSRGYELTHFNSPRRPSLARSHGPKFAILCYHRVGTEGVPLYSQLEPEVFEAQMRFLRSRYRIVSLDTIHKELLNPDKTEPAVAITFDDGYRDVYTHAFPVLQRYAIPATIFVTGSAIESGEVSWYDKVFLALDLAVPEKLDLMLDKPRRFFLANHRVRLQAAQEIIGWLRTLPDERRKEFCRDLERLVTFGHDRIANRMLTWDQIRTMHAAGIGFGAHTLSHPALSRLSASALDEELRGSKAILEKQLGVPVSHFAYPFGKPADYKTTEQAVARCGYRTAATTIWGVNTPGVNPYELYRVSLGEERHLATFAFKMVTLFLSANSRKGQFAPGSVISGAAYSSG